MWQDGWLAGWLLPPPLLLLLLLRTRVFSLSSPRNHRPLFSPPPLACRNSSSSSTLRCRSSLLRGLRCFTYVPNRCMYVYTPVRNNAGRATTLAHPLLRPTIPGLALFLPSFACHTNPYLYVFYPPTTHIAPSHLRRHPRGIASTIRNAHHRSSPFTHLSYSRPWSRASLSPVSTSVFLKCPIQSARRVRYRK